MKTQMKQWLMTAAMVSLAVVVGGVSKVVAASTDTILLVVTPSVNYSVSITSADANVAYNFGTVGLNSTTLSERPAVVTNNGNIVSEWQVSAVGENTWTLGTATGAVDAAVLGALFNHRNGVAPTVSQFNTLNGSTITVSAVAAENNTLSTAASIVTNIPVNAQRDLYFALRTPLTSSVGTQQNFRVYVTAVAP